MWGFAGFMRGGNETPAWVDLRHFCPYANPSLRLFALLVRLILSSRYRRGAPPSFY
jgi:hypothetical protein